MSGENNTIEHFKRFEIKYIADLMQMNQVRQDLSQLFKLAPYSTYFIQSIYFDGPRYEFYGEKREGLKDRVKPRIRVYRLSQYSEPIKIYLELKYRSNDLVSKERFQITKEQCQNLLKGARLNSSNDTYHKFYSLQHKHDLRPAISLMYKREAYIDILDGSTRLTFDSLLRSTLNTSTMEFPRTADYSIDPRHTILELKYAKFLQQSILNYFHRCGFQRMTISKYATCMEQQFQLFGSRYNHLPSVDFTLAP